MRTVEPAYKHLIKWCLARKLNVSVMQDGVVVSECDVNNLIRTVEQLSACQIVISDVPISDEDEHHIFGSAQVDTRLIPQETIVSYTGTSTMCAWRREYLHSLPSNPMK
jgi:hypothetical protein